MAKLTISESPYKRMGKTQCDVLRFVESEWRKGNTPTLEVITEKFSVSKARIYSVLKSLERRKLISTDVVPKRLEVRPHDCAN